MSTQMNQDLIEFKEASLGIFSNSLEFAHKVSRDLRNFQKIIPTTQKLDQLISKINDGKIDLIFVDLKTYAKVFRILNAHPKIQNKSVLIVLCKEANESIFSHDLEFKDCSLNIYQTLNLDDDFPFHVQSLLSWLSHHKVSKNLERSRVRELNIIRDKYQDAWGKLEASEKSSDQFNYLYQMILNLKSKEIFSLENFIDEFSALLGNWKSVKSFSFYHLSISNRSLVSRTINHDKCIDLPSIELGENSNTGIKKIFQEQAYQVVFEMMGIQTIALRVEGLFDKPDMICFINLKPKVFEALSEEDFNWDMVENSLSHIYRGTLIQKDEEVEQAQFMTIWDSLSMMDATDSEEFGYKYFNIDFLSFNRFVSKNKHVKFLWSEFFRECLLELSNTLSNDCKITTFGTTHILLMIPSNYVDKEFIQLKKFVEGIEFWKYFSDSKLVMPSYVYPKVYLVPKSSSFYISKILFGEGSKEEVVRIHENSFPTKRI